MNIDNDMLSYAHWICTEFGRGLGDKSTYQCSECNMKFKMLDCYNYCPNCGAKMERII